MSDESDAIENSRNYTKFNQLATSNWNDVQGATGRNALYEVKRYFYAALQWNCAIGGLAGLMVCIGISADLTDFDWSPKCHMCDKYRAERTTSYCCCFRAKERWSSRDLDVIAVMTSGCWLADYLQTIWEIGIGRKPTSTQSKLLLDAIRK